MTPDDAFSRFGDDHISEMTDATGTYSYCSDNPVNFVDPTGNQSEWATARIAALIGGRTVIRGQMAKEVFFFKLNLIKSADFVLESYEAVQKSARRAGGMFRAAIDKRKEAAAQRQSVAASASTSKGVDPAGAVATASSASLGQGQTVKGGSQPTGRFARFEAALGAIARDGANIAIEQKLRAHFRQRQMKAKTKAGRRAEKAHWVKANPRLAAQKGAGSGTRPRR